MDRSRESELQGVLEFRIRLSPRFGCPYALKMEPDKTAAVSVTFEHTTPGRSRYRHRLSDHRDSCVACFAGVADQSDVRLAM